MKKLLVLMMAIVMTLSLAACGGESAPEDSDTNAGADTEITLATKEANFTSLLVPSDFGEFQDNDGTAFAESDSANIVITPTIVPEVRIESITEDSMVSLFSESYSNIEVLSFENPTTVAGVDAVVVMISGDGVTSGVNKTICHITLFFSIDGQDCEQQVVLTYNTGADSSLEANLDEIIASISLE